MTATTPSRPSPKPSEDGYILVAVMFMLALLIIALTVAAPRIAKSIQRDREVETMHRGKQYARAVKLYYKQFNTYPPNIDALVKTNEIRFLRKKYIDPTTGKDEWKIVRYGQQKTQTLGFFGQPIGGAAMPGVGNSGTIGSNGQAVASPIGGFGPSNPGSSFFSSSPPSSSSTGGASTDPTSGTTSSGASSSTGGTDPTTSGSASGQNGSNGSTFGTPGAGQTFGGAGIMGFSPNSPKQSILVYKKKNHYNEWEFLYDPLAEQMMMMGGSNLGTVGTPAGSMNGSSPIGSGSTIGSGGSTIGSGSSTIGSGASGGVNVNPPSGPQQ
jgi:type II secretory pathway pseudopilin PulG